MDMGQVCTTGAFKTRSDGLLDAQFRTLVPMDFMQYSQSPVMKMDCSNSFACEFEVEGREKKYDDSDKNWTFGFLGTDYDNWFVMYGCGNFWGQGVMQTLTIYGKGEKIDDKYIEEAKEAIKSKVPEFKLNSLLM